MNDGNEKLPLDSPEWLPDADAHRVLCQRTGDRHLAAQDLTKVMADGDVPSMRRCFARGRSPDGELVPLGPDRELLPRSFWSDYELDSWSDALLVVPRRRGGQVVPLRGFAFYVWKPALAKIWPTLFPPDEEDEDGWAVRRAKDLIGTAFPNGEWRTMGTKEVQSGCAKEAEAQKVKLPGVDSFARAMGRRPHK
jgi:hypothetical protein